VVVGDLTSTILVAAPGAAVTSPPNANIHIGTRTLSLGGPAITQSGTTYSILPSGNGVLIAAFGRTTVLPPVALTIAPPSSGVANKPGTAGNTDAANNAVAANNAGATNTNLPITTTTATTAGPAFHPIGTASQPAWTIGGNHIITEGQAWTANGTIFSDVSGTLFTGAAPPATTTVTTALTSVVKQGAAAAVRIREISWPAGVAAGACVLSGVLAVVL
jgi:hypothetical protein